ncbi:MAG: glycosyltransferase family 2 protein, partial [Chryseotalea sp.]
MVYASIVIYHPKYNVLKQAVESAIQSPHIIKLFIVDNSKQPTEFDYFNHQKIEFIFNNKNVGFGKAHNQA